MKNTWSRLDIEDLGIVRVRINSPYNSFFGMVSELSDSRIIISTYRVLGSDDYYVLALSSEKDVGVYIDDIVKREKYVRRSKIKRLRYHYIDDILVIYGVKSKCEFLGLIEDSGVVLLTPYIFYKGAREYLVLARRNMLHRYLDNVEKYYGIGHVEWRELSDPEDLVKSILGGSILSIIADRLTEQEVRVLKTAYEGGYFNYPKNSRQTDIGSMLDRSKVTISIHIRKALRKIVSDVIKTIYYTEQGLFSF
ncbi:hypothetical protein ATG_03240 [Desulfurococcaceae archaeon AG1]|nr:hypothetical protein ATG_03240 [Desulfurococcaceae archaeon AG1]